MSDADAFQIEHLAAENAKLRGEVAALNAELEDENSFSVQAVANLKRAQAAELEVERLRDKCASCEQCEGPTDSGVVCIRCWNRVHLSVLGDRMSFTDEGLRELEISPNMVERKLAEALLAQRGLTRALELQVDVLKKALHKIACAECTVHDKYCERQSPHPSSYCACDARVAGHAIPGYYCPVLTEKRKDEAPPGGAHNHRCLD